MADVQTVATIAGGNRVVSKAEEESANIIKFINDIHRNGVLSDVIRVHGGEAEVITRPIGGGVEVLVRSAGGEAATVGEIRIASNGSAEFSGYFSRPVRSAAKLGGWKIGKFFISEEVARALQPDEYIIHELQNYFGQKFNPNVGKYAQPSKLVFESAEAKEIFELRMKHFFNEGEGVSSSFSKRWAAPDGKFGDFLYDKKVSTSNAAKKFQPRKVSSKKLPKVSFGERGEFSVGTFGSAPPGNPQARTSHRILSVRTPTVIQLEIKARKLRGLIAEADKELKWIDTCLEKGILNIETALEANQTVNGRRVALDRELKSLLEEHNLRVIGDQWKKMKGGETEPAFIGEKRIRLGYNAKKGMLVEASQGEKAIFIVSPEGKIIRASGKGLSTPHIWKDKPLRFAGTRHVAIEMPSQIYEGLDTIAISHLHADHMDARALLKQIGLNAGAGKSTTLLLSEEAADGIISELAISDGWHPKSERSPIDYLNERYSLNGEGLVRVEGKVVVGSKVVEMRSNPFGAHGPDGGRVVVSSMNGEIEWLYSGDGDFSMKSLKNQLKEVKSIQELRLSSVASLTEKESVLLKKYKGVEDIFLSAQEEFLMSTRDDLLSARYVEVDTGTTGFDTHGPASTVHEIRRAKLAKHLNLSEQVAGEILEVAKSGDKVALEAILKRSGVKFPKQTATHLDFSMGVRATHNQYAPVGEIAEGRVDVYGAGQRVSTLPALGSELHSLGAREIKAGKGLEVTFRGETVKVADSRVARGAIKRLVEKYSTLTPQGDPVFTLEELLVNGKKVVVVEDGAAILKIGEESFPLKQPKIPEHRVSINPGNSPLIKRGLPQWLQRGGRAEKLYSSLRNVLLHAEEFKVPKRVAEVLRNVLESPSTFQRVASLMESSPIFAWMVKNSSGIVKGAKAMGATAILGIVVYEIASNYDGLKEGDSKSWGKVTGSIGSIAIVMAPYVAGIDFVLTGAMLGARTIINLGDVSQTWDDVGEYSFPIMSLCGYLIGSGVEGSIEVLQGDGVKPSLKPKTGERKEPSVPTVPPMIYAKYFR